VDTTTQLFLSIVVSSFGLAYFVYGKKQKKFIPTLSGIAMMAYPYFVKNLFLYFAVWLVCLILPFVVRE
jgi:hypothetical protein